jgi:transcriptional regulator with XRE-family HTH domain
MMHESLAQKLRVLRAERGWTLNHAAERAGVQPETISDAEHGKRRPYMPTLSKIAKGYGVSVEELLEEPVLTGKAEAPEVGLAAQEGGIGLDAQLAQVETARLHTSQLAVLEEQQRNTMARVLREYMMRRAEAHDREVRDPESPHFRTATGATLWLDDLYRELRDWWVWVYVHRSELLPPFEEGTNPEFWRAAFDAYLAPVVAFQTIRKQAEKRIAEMSDPPDELAMRRMEASWAAAEEARQRLETAGDEAV